MTDEADNDTPMPEEPAPDTSRWADEEDFFNREDDDAFWDDGEDDDMEEK